MLKTKFGVLAVIVLVLSACSQPATIVHMQGKTMGTTYNVKFSSAEQVNPQELQSVLDQELILINKLMSTYDPESELSKFNRHPHEELYPLSDATLLVIKEALKIGIMSDGYLDITVGPLVNLWGFGPQARPEKIPSELDIAEAKKRVGLDLLRIEANGAVKRAENMFVDLSTVAKGYGVDQLAEILESKGIYDYLVEIGGEMRVAGVKPNGEEWIIAIEKPISLVRAKQQVISVGNNAVATAGDYRNYFEENDIRYSHLIDPVTGFPIQHKLVSVTVVHPSSLVADGLATAIIVMGKEAGLKMALRENLNVLLITRENGEFKEYTTPGFEPYMKK